ncbi:NTF2-like N-terminal transpeptidase domain-containing protein, partial [Micromonospora azadirachtae]
MRLSYPRHRGRTRPNRHLVALTAVLLAAGALTACSGEDAPERTVEAFLSGWHSGNLNAVGFVDATGAKVPADEVLKEIKELSGELATTPPTLRRQGDAKITADTATAGFRIEWALPGDTRWAYDRQVRLTHADDGQWQVIWEPQVVQEQLARGDRLGLRR